jgi:hypothetical protein
MYIFLFLLSSFGALYFGRTFCIYMGCTDIEHCIYDICGLWTVFMVCVYGFVFTDMYMGLCVWIFMDLYGCVSGYVFGYVYGYRVSILREARFKYRGLPLFGARFHHHWDLLLHEAHFSEFWVLPLPGARFHHHWDLLLHEAHFSEFWVLLLHKPI